MSEITRLTDRVGIIGLDASEYGELEEQQTTISTDLLRQGMDLIDTLGWDQVDVITVEPTTDNENDQPMLVLRPPGESLLSKEEQAGVAITPRTKDGREK